MKRFGIGMALAAALFFSVAAEAGETKDGRFAVGLEAGYSLPLAEFGDFYAGSFTVGGNLFYGLTDSLSVGLGVMTAFDHPPDSDPAQGADFSALVFGVTPAIAYTLPLSESLALHCTVKGGGYYIRETAESTEVEVFEVPAEETFSDFVQIARTEDTWELGFSGGAGLEYSFDNNISLGLNLNYHFIFTEDDPTQLLTPMLSLGYSF